MANIESEFGEISATLMDYFDGIFEGDTEKLDHVFHSDGRLSCATDGTLVSVDKEDYLKIVASRKSPRDSGAKRYDRIISIDMAGPGAAIAKVECAIPPKYFTDLLTLIKLEGRWRIINKTYHYIEHS